MFRTTAAVALAMALSACSKAPGTDYFPLESGAQWHYQLDYVMPDGKRSATLGIRTLGGDQFNTEDRTLKGMVRRTSDGTDYYIDEREDGFYRIAKRVVVETRPKADPEPRLVLPKGKNLRRGFAWTLKTDPYVMHWMPPFAEANASIKPFDMVYEIAALDDTVETPAGKFERCIRVEGNGTMVFYADASAGYQEVPITHAEWYAPGVGLIKVERSEPLDTMIMKGGKVSMQLSRFEL